MRTVQLYAAGSVTASAVAYVTIPSAGKIRQVIAAVMTDMVADNALIRLELSKVANSQLTVNGAQDPFLTLAFAREPRHLGDDPRRGEYVIPDGRYIKPKHTSARMKTEIVMTKIADRDARSIWEKKGSKDTQAHAMDKVREIMAKNPAPLISPEVEAKLWAAFPGLVLGELLPIEEYAS